MSRQLTCGRREYAELMGSSPEEGLAGVRARDAELLRPARRPGLGDHQQFSYWDFPAAYGEDLAILVRLVATGRPHPEIGRVAGWADTAVTLADLRERRIRGNAILTMS